LNAGDRELITKRSILILDCTTKGDPSEGLLLKEFFRICKLHRPAKSAALYYKINSKKEFLSKLNTGKRYDIIHISAHGAPGNEVGLGNGSTWWVTPEEIVKTKHKAKLVFANACLANKKTIADAFKGAKYFLAPDTVVQWIDAAIFSLTFYKRYIVDGTRMHSAVAYARRRTQTSRDYPSLWR
jgi:hypothetical protein